MASEHTNRAEPGSHVGVQIAHLEGGDFNQVNVSVQQAGVEDLRRLLIEQIMELRHAISAAERRGELSSSDSQAAQQELDAATARVREATGADRSRLAATLGRVRGVLSGGLNVLGQLAAIVAAIKGL